MQRKKIRRKRNWEKEVKGEKRERGGDGQRPFISRKGDVSTQILNYKDRGHEKYRK
jgi:hypothetical protein